jgi:hypothetical protein
MLVYDYEEREGVAGLREGLHRERMRLLHYAADGALLGTVGSFLASDQFQARWGPSGMIMTEAPFGRTTSANVGNGQVFVATGDTDEIAVFTQSGELERLIRRVAAPISVTAEMEQNDRDRRVAEESSELADRNTEARVIRLYEELPYPGVLPPYAGTVVDSDANLWVQDFRLTDDEPNSWSVFDAEGIWLGGVTLPEGLPVQEIGSGYVLGRTVDDLGVERVQVYGLSRVADGRCEGAGQPSGS